MPFGDWNDQDCQAVTKACSYVLVGRCYLFREKIWEVFLIKGNYGIKAEGSFETRESGHETERND
jgi:hypothetical protein